MNDRRGRRVSLPVPVLVLAGIAGLFFALPLVGLLWRAPWTRAWGYLTEHDSLLALRLSLICSLWATLLSIVFGVPLAWLLARVAFPGRSVLRARCACSRSSCPLSSVASHCSSPSAAAVLSGNTSIAGLISGFPSQPPAWSLLKRSWRCRSW